MAGFFWEGLLAEGKCGMNPLGPVIRQKLESAPELRKPIEDLTILEKHQELIDLLMTVVFPPAFWESDCAAAFVPFQFTSFYATPAFKSLFRMEEPGFTPQLNIDPQRWEWGRILKAYTYILQKSYGIDLTWSYPLIAKARCPKTGLDRFFNIVFDPKFLEIKVLGEPRSLAEEDPKRLLANVTDLKVWMELIPPENFEFQGFGVFKAADVTAREMLSALQADLFEKEAIFQRDSFAGLQEKLQIYLQEKDISLGLAAIRGDRFSSYRIPINSRKRHAFWRMRRITRKANSKDQFFLRRWIMANRWSSKICTIILRARSWKSAWLSMGIGVSMLPHFSIRIGYWEL